MTTAEKRPAAPAAVKPVEEKAAAAAPKAVEAKAADPKTEKKAAAKKPAAPKTEKKPAAKKEAAPKAEKKTAAKTEPKANIVVEYQGRQVYQADILAGAKKVWAEAGQTAAIKTMDLYVKPEDGAVYCVINGKSAGKFSF